MYPLEQRLTTNFLSSHWRDIVRDDKKPTLATPFFYVGGMVGYALSLPIRTIAIGKDAIFLIGRFFYACASCEGETIKTGFIVLGGSVAELGIAIIGIICPPIAYSLDERLYSYPTISENSWAMRIFTPNEIPESEPEKVNDTMLIVHFKQTAQYLRDNGFLSPKQNEQDIRLLFSMTFVEFISLNHKTHLTTQRIIEYLPLEKYIRLAGQFQSFVQEEPGAYDSDKIASFKKRVARVLKEMGEGQALNHQSFANFMREIFTVSGNFSETDRGKAIIEAVFPKK